MSSIAGKRLDAQTFSADFVERFWAKVTKGYEHECWEWNASKRATGYGVVRYREGTSWFTAGAHRVSYAFAHGICPPLLLVCHTCDNPPCVNPAHLFTGTPQDNMLDCSAKGRMGPRPLAGDLHPSRKISQAQANEIRTAYEAGMPAVLAERYGVKEGTIRQVVAGRNWVGESPTNKLTRALQQEEGRNERALRLHPVHIVSMPSPDGSSMVPRCPACQSAAPCATRRALTGADS